ncbi:MAG: radical SAM protein, partial [Thermoplasmata archaeon]|nr:radical SAM protein [Thermoplasmata archaeon]
SFPELLEKMDHPERVEGIYFRNSGKAFFTGRRESVDFDQLPVPTREFPDLDIRKYAKTPFSIGVQTKRGCAFRCAYCIYPFLQGRHLRLRSPEKVVDEIENLIDFYDIKELFFADTVFNFPLNHAREICRELMKRKLHIEWRAWFREDCINKKFIIQVRNAGCEVLECSPDGGSQKALDVLQKNLRFQDITKTYELAGEVEGMRVISNFMCNIPGEDSKTVADFYKLLFKIITKHSTVLKYTGLTNIRIYPKTKIYQIALREGLINRQTDLLTPTFYNPSPFNVAYLPAKLTRGPLHALSKIPHAFHSIRSRSRGVS